MDKHLELDIKKAFKFHFPHAPNEPELRGVPTTKQNDSGEIYLDIENFRIRYLVFYKTEEVVLLVEDRNCCYEDLVILELEYSGTSPATDNLQKLRTELKILTERLLILQGQQQWRLDQHVSLSHPTPK